MKFIQTILDNSGLKEAKLYTPASKAYKNPETGITIQNKSAYHVIKDCAGITIKYLPHYILGEYADPIKALAGKFTVRDIQEFVEEARKDYVLEQLLIIVLDKIKKTNTPTQPSSATIQQPSDSSDPYGEYGSSSEIVISYDQESTDVEIICKAFKAV